MTRDAAGHHTLIPQALVERLLPDPAARYRVFIVMGQLSDFDSMEGAQPKTG